MDTLPLVSKDAWLAPVRHQIERRYQRYIDTKQPLEQTFGSLYAYANAHKTRGLHYCAQEKAWIFRDWLPQAKHVFLVGDFNGWEPCQCALNPKEGGVWEIILPDREWKDKILPNSRYKLNICGQNGWKHGLSAYTFACEQDSKTKEFYSIVKRTDIAYDWGNYFKIPLEKREKELLIYEAHIGMAAEKEGVGSFKEFTLNILPHIQASGYTAVQLMALAEHPYYGSFGYQVSNFFSPSSRLGTPDELRDLIKTAHSMGILVIMDLVHAHFVSNTNEGLNQLDGSEALYNYPGERGNHPYWKSKIFDYGKEEVRRFLLSNIRYWMEEFGIDGFRFDGVSSMIYEHHGYIDNFGTYDNYFGDQVNEEALLYLSLANDLIHQIYPQAISIAEEVSGMPGMTSKTEEGGFGFDYRMGMGIPDYWVKLLKEESDAEWNLEQLYQTLNSRLPNVKTLAYVESHDQAMVGDQTLIFRLIGEKMYSSMHRQSEDIVVDRGVALTKMIKTITMFTGGQAYLNFMGNEFGHPEWIDFPREENAWSYVYARRQWSLLKNKDLRYHLLWAFDKALLALAKKVELHKVDYADILLLDQMNQTIAFFLDSGFWIFVFNFHPSRSIPDYELPMPRHGKYEIFLSSDEPSYGGFDRLKKGEEKFTFEKEKFRARMKIYNVCRTVQVFRCLDK